MADRKPPSDPPPSEAEWVCFAFWFISGMTGVGGLTYGLSTFSLWWFWTCPFWGAVLLLAWMSAGCWATWPRQK